MNHKYIFFNEEMIEKIKSGKKTQTRRPIRKLVCCYGKPGDRLLLIKRTPASAYMRDHFPRLFSRFFFWWIEGAVEVVSIEAKPLKKYIDLKAEGFDFDPKTSRLFFNGPAQERERFFEYWDKIYGNTIYKSINNPPVWVIEFKVV